MSNGKFVLIPIILILLIGVSSAATIIGNCAGLQAMADDLAETYILDFDIDCAGVDFVPVGNFTDNFVGEFRGEGHTISNLLINQTGVEYVGLFGFVHHGNFSNVRLLNVNVTGLDDVGALIGYCGEDTTRIWNTSSNGTVRAIASSNGVGGLIGEIGGNAASWLNLSYSSANVYGQDSVGGLVGATDGNISNSFATGMVTATGDFAGGLTSNLQSGRIILNCYSAGAVTGASNTGGLVGGSSGVCTNSYWNAYLSGQTISACGTELTNAQMQLQSSFAGFDFTTTWGWLDGYLPYLRTSPFYFSPGFPAVATAAIVTGWAGTVLKVLIGFIALAVLGIALFAFGLFVKSNFTEFSLTEFIKYAVFLLLSVTLMIVLMNFIATYV